jgi:hypothetical protein
MLTDSVRTSGIFKRIVDVKYAGLSPAFVGVTRTVSIDNTDLFNEVIGQIRHADRKLFFAILQQ